MSFKNLLQDFSLKYAHNLMQKTLFDELNITILKEPLIKLPKENTEYMLYIHVPFCHTFCPYCSFHKYSYQTQIAEFYFDNLRKELQSLKAKGFDFTSLYVGGGTTLINEEQLLKTLELAKKLFNISQISAESDPNHISKDTLTNFKGLIDRLSVGVQSFDDETLKRVARFDKFGDSKTLKNKLEQAVGILPILSLDLIFNLPNQSKEILLNDIKIAKDIQTQQITFYPLMKSELTKEAIAKSLGVDNVNREREFYDIICDEFKDFHQNNAWSFSKEKFDLQDEYVGSNHEYIGAGSGAFSFSNGRLIINAFNLNQYAKLVENDKGTSIAVCDFTAKSRLQYLFLTELFDGEINIDRFNLINKTNLKKSLFFEISALKAVGAIKECNNTLKATKFGNYLSLTLMRDFYAGMDKIRAIFKDDAKIKRSDKLRIMAQ